MGDTLTELEQMTEVIPYEDTDDHGEHLTHIINPPANIHIWKPGMTSQDVVDIARATDQEVVSLCGKRWVPKRNPEKYDVCKSCMDVAGNLMRGAGE